MGYTVQCYFYNIMKIYKQHLTTQSMIAIFGLGVCYSDHMDANLHQVVEISYLWFLLFVNLYTASILELNMINNLFNGILQFGWSMHLVSFGHRPIRKFHCLLLIKCKVFQPVLVLLKEVDVSFYFIKQLRCLQQ